ncbi:MAG: osmotically inducible protein C [Gammaproteobacteria bacterium]|nr:osmotically inducible protein C [Gammaproteobacteria bacterium]MAY02007.1 osmotically inducible protein C [Gammaproteobacteria bacterium]|tara:strand:- start:1318 stop:1731 length:414 start_codon:yes stop_codon:yes gene_type:complete
MKATINWLEAARMEGESGSGHKLLIDGPESIGGLNQGMRPMELMLMSVGACSLVDVISILKKSRQQVENCIVEVDGERADAVPAVFVSIHLHFRVSGADLDEKKVQRAVELSAEKYCSASIMLKNAGVRMTHSVEMI